ncbi:MAG: alanine--glyoxylate aminotransferase family protein [Bacteroidales bacterium]|nr:MAG: alanine--glyoxylate aminotransferase family protein [Bacteroidales bacterium]
MKDRPLLMIPGPIEFDPDVIKSMNQPGKGHVSPDFIEVFGQAIQQMRKVWMCPSGQPFIIAGSGTLAMDMAAANLIEAGEKALVISTGYFSDRFAELLTRYGADVTMIAGPLGHVPDIEKIEAEMNKNEYKLLTLTHVDTSTAVRIDPEPFGKLGRKYGTITVLDGVCSVAGEEIRQERWDIDVVLTASQKALGVPAGLALMIVSSYAMERFRSRETAVGNYYVDWNNWLPVMNAYESGKPSYFGTPPVNLVYALKKSLDQILEEGMETRFERHRKLAAAVRSALKALGIDQLPENDEIAANTLSAPRYPTGIEGARFLQEVNKAGAILAGGLHPEIKNEYFRIGHMGTVSRGDILVTIGAIETGLLKCGIDFREGSGIKAASEIFNT